MEGAGCPRGPGGPSARTGRTIRKCLPNLHYRASNNELSEPYPQTIHAEKTVRTLLADRPANFEQPKTPDKTYRNEETQELMKNMMNTWSAGSSRTVREHLADCPPRGQSSPNSKTQTRLHLSVHGSPKWLKLLR
jgi:catalase